MSGDGYLEVVDKYTKCERGKGWLGLVETGIWTIVPAGQVAEWMVEKWKSASKKTFTDSYQEPQFIWGIYGCKPEILRWASRATEYFLPESHWNIKENS